MRKAYLNLTLTLLLLIGLPVAVYLAQRPQDIRNRAASTTTTTTYSVVMNQQSPRFGDSVNFTMVFPKEADRKVGRQQMNNPDVDTSCYQNNVRIFQAITTDVSKTNNGDGSLTGISGFITLAGGGNGMIWTSGGATCYATLYYFGHDEQIHVLAQQRDIYVAP